MKVLFFANKMPDLCGAFLHDIDLAIELQKRGHQVVFLIIKVPKEGYNGSYYRGFRYMHYTAGTSFLDTSEIWICPHSPILPDVRKINSRGYHRPIVATCHFDGNYTAIRGNAEPKWKEMLCFINRTMEPNYRKNIVPWPSAIVRAEVIRPIMHREKIIVPEPFQGDSITLVNANQNKGVHVFLELARRMPDRKFLGVLPYYGELRVPPAPSNVTWVPFDDDIRNILRKTRILIIPSYYESFGRIAVEAMINRIPVLYSKPNPNSIYPGGSTEGMQEWIGETAVACERERPEEWMDAIRVLDDEEVYQERSEKSKQHIDSLNLFTEASRIAGIVESFSQENPVEIRSSTKVVPQVRSGAPTVQEAVRPREPIGRSAAGFGFSNGQLKIRR
jgi:glycosyltransferase involved in cell wall biosynthesis